MRSSAFDGKAVLLTLLLAAALWFVTFSLDWGVFWFKISISSLVLAALAFRLQPWRETRFAFNLKAVGLGILSAALLYLIFWAGKALSGLILPFAGEQIGAIYGKGEGTPMWLIALLLFFVTGPCEEIYWRGFLQKKLMLRFGNGAGWLMAVFFYAGVHIWSFNFMLTGAAAVAGAFWGAMYWFTDDLAPVIVSHAIWSTFIFAVMPVP